MIDQARITTTTQFYDKDWKDGLTEIGATPESPVKKTQVMWSDIPQWSKKSWNRHAKKVEENLELLQQGKEEEAEVFVGNNTRQRSGLNMVSRMLEEHLKKVANITLERRPSQATELLGTEVVTWKEAAGKDSLDREPSHNQMENEPGKQYQEMPITPVMLVRDIKVLAGTMREVPVEMPIGLEGIGLITPAYQHRDIAGPETWTRHYLASASSPNDR